MTRARSCVTHKHKHVTQQQTALDHYVRTYRKISGLTQGDLASLLGHKTSNLITTIENGKPIHKTEIAIGLALILGVTVETLITGMIQKQMSLIQQNAISLLNDIEKCTPQEVPRYQQRHAAIGRLAQSINQQTI